MFILALWTPRKCDLPLAKDANFLEGLGLYIHIRVRYWSDIETVAIKIGNDILEIEGSPAADDTEAHYWFNFLSIKATSKHWQDFPFPNSFHRCTNATTPYWLEHSLPRCLHCGPTRSSPSRIVCMISWQPKTKTWSVGHWARRIDTMRELYAYMLEVATWKWNKNEASGVENFKIDNSSTF